MELGGAGQSQGCARWVLAYHQEFGPSGTPYRCRLFCFSQRASIRLCSLMLPFNSFARALRLMLISILGRAVPSNVRRVVEKSSTFKCRTVRLVLESGSRGYEGVIRRVGAGFESRTTTAHNTLSAKNGWSVPTDWLEVAVWVSFASEWVVPDHTSAHALQPFALPMTGFAGALNWTSITALTTLSVQCSQSSILLVLALGGL